MAEDFVRVTQFDNRVHITFLNESQKVFDIGEKMNQINENAYMNGYNWEAFFNHYLETEDPDLLKGLDPDPEAGMYCADYPLSDENYKKAKKFEQLIISLIKNEEKLYDYLRQNGDKIQWD